MCARIIKLAIIYQSYISICFSVVCPVGFHEYVFMIIWDKSRVRASIIKSIYYSFFYNKL